MSPYSIYSRGHTMRLPNSVYLSFGDESPPRTIMAKIIAIIIYLFSESFCGYISNQVKFYLVPTNDKRLKWRTHPSRSIFRGEWPRCHTGFIDWYSAICRCHIIMFRYTQRNIVRECDGIVQSQIQIHRDSVSGTQILNGFCGNRRFSLSLNK